MIGLLRYRLHTVNGKSFQQTLITDRGYITKTRILQKNSAQSIVSGYYLQNVYKTSLQAHMDYVVEHESYRMLHPAENCAPKKESARKGTKWYKKQQKQKEQHEKRQAIRS